MRSEERDGARGARVRWIAPVLIVAIGGWYFAADTGQARTIAAMGAVGLGGLALGAWFFLFSGLPLRARVVTAASLFALGGLAALLFDVRGVTGDLVPIVGWRFGAREDAFRTESGARTSEPAPRNAPGARDFPQFLGLTRDGHVTGPPLERDWNAHPPRELWRRAVGAGWAGFAVAGSDAITQEQRGDREAVVCYDLFTGEERWVHEHDGRYETTLGGVGPRATPTIAGARVFAMGATGVLDALDRQTGAVVWERDTLADAQVANNNWGTSASPLLLGARVVVTPGGHGASMVAYDAASGERAWAGGDEPAGYASPMLATLCGRPQLLAFGNAALCAHDPSDGRVLWSAPWQGRNPNVAQPVVVGADALVISSGYGVGAARLRIEARADGSFAVEESWKSRALKAKFANFVERDGALYGLDDGILACVDAATGERIWKEGRYGHGQLLLANDLLLVTAETGEVVLVEATPREPRELARFEVFTDKTWNPPALATPYLLVRTDVEAACLELPLATGEGAAR